MPPAPTHAQPPPSPTPPPRWHVCCLHRPIIITQIPKFTSGLVLGGVHSMGWGKHSSLWYPTEHFHCPKSPSLLLFTSPSPIPQQPLILLLSTVLLFSECHIIEIIINILNVTFYFFAVILTELGRKCD